MWNLKKYTYNIAVITENGNRITYEDFEKYCIRLTDNIGTRCLIFNLCRNEIGALVGYVACLNAKIVPLMLKADMDFELLMGLVNLYKPDYINVPSDMAGMFPDYGIVYEALDYLLIKTQYNHVYPLNDNLALLLTTSGSTGSPKLVRQSYKNIEANIKSNIECLKITKSDRAITTLPMNFSYGISIINMYLYVGASLILTKKTLMQNEFWCQLKEFEATGFGGVPYTYEMLKRLNFAKMDLPALRYVTQAGGKLSPQLHDYLSKWAMDSGKEFIVMFGMTETVCRISCLPSEKALEKCCSIGFAISNGNFSLIDESRKKITQPNIVGELVYSGDDVTLGYAECGEDLIRGDERNSYIETGDMAKFDSEGYYYIVGRKKRFLKIFGNRVSLDETEQLLKNYFKDIDFACSGVDNKMNVFINNESAKSQVLAFLTERLKLNALAFKIIFISKIPRNESGKIMYNNL